MVLFEVTWNSTSSKCTKKTGYFNACFCFEKCIRGTSANTCAFRPFNETFKVLTLCLYSGSHKVVFFSKANDSRHVLLWPLPKRCNLHVATSTFLMNLDLTSSVANELSCGGYLGLAPRL